MIVLRSFIVWLVIAAAETIHGTLRRILLEPRIGDFRGRQFSVLTGSLLILAIAYLFIRWIGARTRASLIAVGLLWLALTLLFEFGAGRLVLGYSWERLIEDYDLSRGGLLAFGLVLMVFAPLIAAKLRGLGKG